MRVKQHGVQWKAVRPDGRVVGLFETNAAAWKWIDRNTDLGGEEGDHALKQRRDRSIKQHLQAE